MNHIRKSNPNKNQQQKNNKVLREELVEREPILCHPQDLEYEKTFYPFCILSKKRYVGNKYEFDVNKFSQNSMGIVLKRRDNAKIVKKIFGGMVDILLNEIDVDKAVNFIKSSISDLLKGKYPLYNFISIDSQGVLINGSAIW